MPTHKKDVHPLTLPTHTWTSKSCVGCVGYVSQNSNLTQPTLPKLSSSHVRHDAQVMEGNRRQRRLRQATHFLEKNMSHTTTLCLDLGTTTGWAMRAPEGQIAHGFVSFKPQRFEGGGMRYLRFRRWLTEMKASVTNTPGTHGLQSHQEPIGAVYFEEVRRHLGVDAAHVYGGLLATLTAWCEHHQIPYQGVPVGTIKKHVTGKGNAGKAEVIAAMRAKGHPVTDDNEADALALLHWALETQDQTEGQTEHQGGTT
jgi:hypothetical protein